MLCSSLESMEYNGNQHIILLYIEESKFLSIAPTHRNIIHILLLFGQIVFQKNSIPNNATYL